MLQVDRLTKSFGGAPIFQDVCLTVEAGEAVSIMGPSGSGKTTFIRCLNGLERADRGIVSVGRERLDASDPPDRFRIAARCCSPPESSCGKAAARWPTPT